MKSISFPSTKWLVGLIVVAAASNSEWLSAQQVRFNDQIKPILSDRCYVCHGPDEETREAGLRLDLQKGIASVVEPKDLENSELWYRISADDHDEMMPPPDSKLKLTKSEQQLIRKWIEQGAVWEQHWSFVPLPERIKVPQSKSAWGANEIDKFIWKNLVAHRLQPQARATKEKLIRRLTFDLTGLPPTIQEIDAFVTDRSPQAYEKLVDRLLSSSAYGERMASIWLDVARYSDTYGYQVDRDRFVWPWRDWVVRAYNENKPYDEFLREQLAGDLLPNSTDQQILATAFNRLHPQKVEGGSEEEEFRVEYVADRTQTFATGILGLTLECARCHDHKYDPISQKEYYELFGFFDDIDEAGLYSYFTNSVPTPTLRLIDKQQKEQLAKLERARSAAISQFDDTEFLGELEKRFAVWRQSDPKIELPKPIKVLDFEEFKPNGENKIVDGRNGKAVQLSGDDAVGVGVGNFRRDQAFSVTLWIKVPDEKKRAVIFHRSRAWTDSASRGYQLLIQDGKLSASLIHFWPGNAISVESNKIPIGEWVHVAFVYEGTGTAAGLKIFVNGVRDSSTVRDALTKNITGSGGNNITIGERFRDRGFTGGWVDDFKVFDQSLSSLQVMTDFDPERVESLTADHIDDLPKKLRAHFARTIDQEFRKRINETAAVSKQLFDFENKLTEIMVMKQLAKAKQAYLLNRGAYDDRGEKVTAGISGILKDATPFKRRTENQQDPDRLDLANWVTQKNHPLTSRVAVNRIWQMLFGEGLVRTPEDFGSQGKPPTHPELLDWLARDFVDHKWDTKRLIKQIAMSETYRQSSTPSAKALENDPENLWLSHVSKHQLSAEAIRDNALAISGLLTEKIGGPPAKPYEVTVSFKPTGRDKGPNLYRRSLYTYWKRTGPAPVMMTLDASKRDVCRVKRQRTSSPLGALVLLNDPQIIEASRAAADRLMFKHKSNADDVIQEAFRLMTSRRPSQKEVGIARKLFDKMKTHFAANADDTKQFLATGDYQPKHKINDAELAAMTLVMTTLLNHDECIRKY